MRSARLWVSLLVIFAFSRIAIAAPSSRVAWTVTIPVKNINQTHREGNKDVTFNREAVTPFGKIEIGPTGAHAYIRVTEAATSHVVTAKRWAFFFLSFYTGLDQTDYLSNAIGNGKSDPKSAPAYLVGDTLVVPLEGGNGRACRADYMYFAFLHKDRPAVVSKVVGSGCEARVFVSVAPEGSLTMTTWSPARLTVRTYRYTHDAFVLASTRTPTVPAGYSPLITQRMPLKTKVARGNFSLAVPFEPPARAGRLYLDGIQQPLPTHTLFFDGIAQKVFHWGDSKAVILETRPYMAHGSRLQVLRIDKTHLRFSRLFGVKSEMTPEVFYKHDSTKLDFEFVGYDWPCRKKDCAKGDHRDGPFRLYPITYQAPSLVYQRGSISLSGNGEAITTHENFIGDKFGLPAVIRRARHNPPRRWFLMNAAGRCAPAHPRTPAALIRRDLAQSYLQDNVHVFERKDGVPVGVTVSEPHSGGMATIYRFFRTKAACQSYTSARNQTLKSLQ